ncbi:MAG: serine/threonine protein kinase [Lentisphaeria bacterium]|nr:serine/threonine protein kinase [Lentisphaeria bacterium]
MPVIGRVDRYLLHSQLGKGAFGIVYLATDSLSGILVALKSLPPKLSKNQAGLEKVRQNFALIHKLNHPNIASVYHLHEVLEVDSDIGFAPKDFLLVQEYVSGITLDEWIKTFPGKKISVEGSFEILKPLAQALDYAHSRNIIHRDIKPGNIMVSEDGIKILDFGLAARVVSDSEEGSVKDVSGTRPYMAPEQWKGEKQGKETDQYALAVTFYRMIKGELPFQTAFESGDLELMHNTVVHDIPQDIQELSFVRNSAIKRALAKSPEDRFNSCEDFVNQLSTNKQIAASSQNQYTQSVKEINIDDYLNEEQQEWLFDEGYNNYDIEQFLRKVKKTEIERNEKDHLNDDFLKAYIRSENERKEENRRKLKKALIINLSVSVSLVFLSLIWYFSGSTSSIKSHEFETVNKQGEKVNHRVSVALTKGIFTKKFPNRGITVLRNGGSKLKVFSSFEKVSNGSWYVRLVDKKGHSRKTGDNQVNSTNYWWFSGVNFASGPLKLEVYLNNRHVATETILVSNNLFYSPWFLVCLFIILTVSNKVFLSYRESIIDS